MPGGVSRAFHGSIAAVCALGARVGEGNKGLTTKDIADKLKKTEDEVKAIFTYFDILNNFERELFNIDTKS